MPLAVLIAVKPGCRPRLIYRTRHGRRRRIDKRKGFTETGYARLLDAAHQQLGGPLVVVWDYVPRHIIPDQNDRGVELLVRGGDQCGVAGFGHRAALAFAPAVDAKHKNAPALRRVVDGLPEGSQALLVGHSPTNEAAVAGLAGRIVPPLGNGKGILLIEDGETTGWSRCTERPTLASASLRKAAAPAPGRFCIRTVSAGRITYSTPASSSTALAEASSSAMNATTPLHRAQA